MTFEIDAIPLHSVRVHKDTQSRVAMNEATITEYAEAITAGIDFPPVVTFFDGKEFWLADGFHRYFAHKAAGAMEILSELREGSQRDAILFSVGANASHGLRRTNEDKKRAVMTLLNDSEWAAWSGNQIAKACAVSESFVRHLRINEDTPAPITRTVERNGTTYEQNTANIGKTKTIPESVNDGAPETGTVAGPVVQTTPPAAASEDHAPNLHEQIEELSASLKSTLADNEMMGRVFDADDRIKAAMDEAKRQKAIADSAERTLAAKNGEFVARAKQVTYWKNRATKAEAALTKAPE